jgi:RNA polymerase sigma-70 factor (ECF subfamily)
MAGDMDRKRRFETLLDEHRKIVFKVARVYARGQEDRNDLAQEIAAHLWRSFPGYDDTRRFSTWMYRIALNVGISHARREIGRIARFEPLDDAFAGRVPEYMAGDEPDERLRELWIAIDALEPLDRALVMLYLDERSYAEIAEVIGISETNVATKLSRIKQRLRKRMDTASHAPIQRTHPWNSTI